MKYEYTTIEVGAYDAVALVDKLDKLGQQGWQAICLVMNGEKLLLMRQDTLGYA